MTKGGFKMEINITTPISREKAKSLKAGDMVKITGVIYTARDAATRECWKISTRVLPFL